MLLTVGLMFYELITLRHYLSTANFKRLAFEKIRMDVEFY